MPRSCWSLRGAPLACCAVAPCGGSASAIIQAPNPIATPRIERPPDIGGFFGEPTTAPAAREARSTSTRVCGYCWPCPPTHACGNQCGRRQPPRFPVMTIRIGTSERDGTFYTQGRALETLFERRPALAAVEVMES